MTLTPSASLHVQTPKPGDIKPSTIFPPSPLTPQSNISLMSSRVELPTDPARPSQQLSTISTSTDDQIIDISAQNGLQGDTGHEESSHDPAGGLLTDQRDTLHQGGPGSAAFLGLQCPLTNVLPPSPPLTVADTRDGVEPDAATSTAVGHSAQPSSVTTGPLHMREEDITNWRASMA